MDKILIGLLRSGHKIALKNAMITKLLQTPTTGQQQSGVILNLNELIESIETVWLSELHEAIDDTELVQRYRSLKDHQEPICAILSHYLSRSDVVFDAELLLKHVNDTYRSVFALCTIYESYDPKNQLILLFAWTNILLESFSMQPEHVKFKLNSINILQEITLSMKSSTHRVKYLYLIMNDSRLGCEYLNLISSFSIVNLNLESTLNQSSISQELLKIKSFIEQVQLNTLLFLVDSVAWPEAGSETNNLVTIVQLIKGYTSSSVSLLEQSLKYFISILAQARNVETELSVHTAELFKCFDLTKSMIIIRDYFFDETTKNQVTEAGIRQWILNTIYFLKWPHNEKLDEWICSLMSILANLPQNLRLLIRICEETTEFVLDLIEPLATRRSALNVLSFYLVNYQHSPKLFHKSCPKIIKLLEILKPSEQVETKPELVKDKSFEHLALLSFVCTTQFGGYPQIYKPILDLVKDVDISKFDTFKQRYLIQSRNIELLSQNYTTGSTGGVEDDDSVIISNKHSNLTGLVNLGNTCYLNAMIQSLYSCKRFVKGILDLKVIDPTVLTSSLANNQSMLIQMQILFASIYSTKRNAIKPSSFVKHCTPSWFTLGQQQDTSEFLIFLLDNLNELLKPTANQLIHDTFGIHLVTQCECSNCKTVTTRSDTSYCLHLSLAHDAQGGGNKENLQDLVNRFFHVEHLDDTDNLYSCANCNSLQKATKKISIKRDDSVPEFLTLTLNRFIYKQGTDGQIQNVKIMDQLEYPDEISVETWSLDGQCTVERYQLTSIVVHSGSSIHHGHYYSYAKHTDWYLANDSQITLRTYESLALDLNLFKNDTPYVLFYQRSGSTLSPLELNIDKKLVELIEQDNRLFEFEERTRKIKSTKYSQSSRLDNSWSSSSKREPDDDNNPDPSSYASQQSNSEGPRAIF